MNNVFSKEIHTDEIQFKYAKGMRDVYGKEIHTYNEIFFFLGKKAEFITSFGKFVINPNTLVIIPKENFHQFITKCPDFEYERFVLSFDELIGFEELLHKKLNRIIVTEDKSIEKIFYEIKQLLNKEYLPFEKNALLKSYTAQIIAEINMNENSTFGDFNVFSKITRQAINYINKNLEKELTIPIIAKELYISESYLSHCFTKELNVSVHKYILENRLISANKKILFGVGPMEAAAKCGFKDYSGFYKQYKKYFNKSPSNKKGKH